MFPLSNNLLYVVIIFFIIVYTELATFFGVLQFQTLIHHPDQIPENLSFHPHDLHKIWAQKAPKHRPHLAWAAWPWSAFFAASSWSSVPTCWIYPIYPSYGHLKLVYKPHIPINCRYIRVNYSNSLTWNSGHVGIVRPTNHSVRWGHTEVTLICLNNYRKPWLTER